MITFKKFKFGRSGLGNWLFNYAGVKLYAESNGFDFAMPDWIGTKIFQNIRPWTEAERTKALFCKQVQLDDLNTYSKFQALFWLFSKKEKLPPTKSLESLYKKPRDNISIYGYMQDEFTLNLLKERRETIKSWFRFKETIDNEYRKKTADLKPWMGVHVRKGDFIKLGVDLPVSEYKSKLDEIKKQYPNHKIFIATNDKTILSEFDGYNRLKLSNPLPEIPDYMFDFWMLVNSEAVIGGGSTFSWWAAYLSSKNEFWSTPLTHFWNNLKKVEITKQKF